MNTQINLLQKFDNLTLDECKDVDNWVRTMSKTSKQLKEQFKIEKTEKEIMFTLYRNLPKRGFEMVKTMFSYQMIRSDPLTVEEFRNTVKKYVKDNGITLNKGQDNDQQNNLAFYSQNTTPPFSNCVKGVTQTISAT